MTSNYNHIDTFFALDDSKPNVMFIDEGSSRYAEPETDEVTVKYEQICPTKQEETFDCNVCDDSFTTSGDLVIHKSNHLDKIVDVFSCYLYDLRRIGCETCCTVIIDIPLVIVEVEETINQLLVANLMEECYEVKSFDNIVSVMKSHVDSSPDCASYREIFETKFLRPNQNLRGQTVALKEILQATELNNDTTEQNNKRQHDAIKPQGVKRGIVKDKIRKQLEILKIDRMKVKTSAIKHSYGLRHKLKSKDNKKTKSVIKSKDTDTVKKGKQKCWWGKYNERKVETKKHIGKSKMEKICYFNDETIDSTGNQRKGTFRIIDLSKNCKISENVEEQEDNVQITSSKRTNIKGSVNQTSNTRNENNSEKTAESHPNRNKPSITDNCEISENVEKQEEQIISSKKTNIKGNVNHTNNTRNENNFEKTAEIHLNRNKPSITDKPQINLNCKINEFDKTPYFTININGEVVCLEEKCFQVDANKIKSCNKRSTAENEQCEKLQSNETELNLTKQTFPIVIRNIKDDNRRKGGTEKETASLKLTQNAPPQIRKGDILATLISVSDMERSMAIDGNNPQRLCLLNLNTLNSSIALPSNHLISINKVQDMQTSTKIIAQPNPMDNDKLREEHNYVNYTPIYDSDENPVAAENISNKKITVKVISHWKNRIRSKLNNNMRGYKRLVS